MCSLHYLESGFGKMILFVHGNSQSLEVWNDVIHESALLNYTSVCVDLPGHGNSFRSQNPGNDYSLKGMAKHFAQFVQSLQQREYIIVAASLGSTVVSEALPQLKGCKGLFFVGGCISGKNITPENAFQPNPYSTINYLEDPSEEQLEPYLNLVVFNQEDKFAREKYQQTFLATDGKVRSTLAATLSKGEWSDEVENITKANIQVALVYGKQEEIMQPGYLQNVQLPKWRDEIILIDSAGHSVQIDRPKELADLIADFANDYL